jgi:hypothetical protein
MAVPELVESAVFTVQHDISRLQAFTDSIETC